MLPYQTESIASVIERLPKALEVICDPGAEFRPGLDRKHVFDFEDGLRFIVSRTKFDLVARVHVSASVFGPNAQKHIEGGRPEFVRVVRRRWRQLGRGKLIVVGWSEKGIPHFVEMSNVN